MGNAILKPEEIKHELLNILLKFDSFTKEHGLSYSLAYGTLLGAVRHNGFIPWDDDIDVMMPRPDYDRLIALVNDGLKIPGYQFVGYELGNYPFPYLKFQNSLISVEEEDMESADGLFLWLDIFPLDGVPRDDDDFGRFWGKAYRLGCFCKAGHTKVLSGVTFTKKIGKLVLKPYCKYLGGARRAADRLVAMARECTYSEAEYIADVVWGGPYGLGERLKKTDFERLTLLEFEGHYFATIQNYDQYLTQMYGDYMELPPVEKRMSHGIVARRLD